MRLKQLEVIGFKSFAQRTVLDFPAGITGIVGPNGCGKSNVVDAIRWVLGEQSPKHLRGDSMEDVVFKGNDRVAPLGMAQVSLTFENDPNAAPQSQLDLDIATVPAHFRELSEITVSRRYYRSGESEYFINKTQCRLKDITELFLGTGVGTKAYAIIEQGRVEQLINAKPEDRRLFIEEAAGTTLYRSRKIAAERKMERTRENLLRVSDVLRELERQIQYLHRLAKKAEQFRTYQEESRTLDLMLTGLHRQRLQSVLANDQAELVTTRNSEAELVGEIEKLETQRGVLAQALSQAEEELSRWREQSSLLDAECTSLLQRGELLRREAVERERRGVHLETEIASVQLQQSTMQANLVNEQSLRDRCAAALLHDEGGLQRSEADLQVARQRAAEIIHQVEQLKSLALALATREAECRNLITALTRRSEEAQRKQARLSTELEAASAELAQLEHKLATRQVELVGLRTRLHQSQGEKEQRAERVRQLSEERRQLERETTELNANLVQVGSRLDSLREIQQNYEGYQRGVRTVLREARPDGGVLGVVADVLDVPEQYERAVAAALGDRLQYVIVRDGADGVEAVSALRGEESGRGSFIPMEPRRMDLNGHGSRSMNGSTRRLMDLIKVDHQFEQVAETLLGEVVMVPDLASGLALWRRNGVYVTMVTPEGDTIDPSGVITGGSERPVEEEIVARRRILTELASETENLQRNLTVDTQRLERVCADLASEEAALKALDRDVHALTLELVAAEKDVERLEAERPRWVDRLEVCRFEIAAAAAEQVECESELVRVRADLEGVEAERQQQERALVTSQADRSRCQAEVEDLAGEVTALKVRVAEGRQRHEGIVAALVRLQHQIEAAEQRQRVLGEERQRSAHEREEMQAAAAAANEQREALLVEREAAEAHGKQARIAFDAKVAEMRAEEDLLRRRRDDLETYRATATRLEIVLAEHRLRLDHLVTGIRDKYAVELADPEIVPSEEEEQAASERLEHLREKLARIGEVNVGAIDELRELEERAAFLKTQKEDLERSLDDLEKTIQRLNRASKARFAETFAAVNERFQQVLPRLFRGGEAKLVLTDEHNLLESGVEIVVRPPGKRLETMTLLSGGEKALVAVSLIFSLFLINPTPFCFLDEVDAPLDDANIGRFTDLVQEMSSHSQFIVITHNKRTMQAANVLYGVTMQEPGVSKVISVNMH